MDDEKDNVTSQEKAEKTSINTAHRRSHGRYTISVHRRIHEKNKSKLELLGCIRFTPKSGLSLMILTWDFLTLTQKPVSTAKLFTILFIIQLVSTTTSNFEKAMLSLQRFLVFFTDLGTRFLEIKYSQWIWSHI